MGPAIAPSIALTLPKTRVSHHALLQGSVRLSPTPRRRRRPGAPLGADDVWLRDKRIATRRRALRDMGGLGSVRAMDGAIAAYMDVFTAVPKTPISLN